MCLLYNEVMAQDDPNFIDRCIKEIDAALRTVTGTAAASRASPASGAADQPLSASERDLAARLMRVNHAGEIAAQALYRGQALVARDEALRTALLRAAGEEHDHLAWCETRTRELGKDVSRLTPLWYLGSLAIGTAAGLAGDRVSLGFLAETERQVTAHLDGHLRRLPGQDQRSRRIVDQMRREESQHRHNAVERGATELPLPVRFAMQFAARLMTTVAHYI